MSEREENKKAMGDFISIARKNNYSESMIMNIGIVCASAQMHKSGHSTHDAFVKAKQYVENGKTASENIYELMKLAGCEN